MLLTCKDILKVLPLIKITLYNNDSSFLIKTIRLCDILTIFKNHFKYQFKVLTCISGVDYPRNFYRFQIVYEFLSVKYNSRIRVKILTNELAPVTSIEKLYPAATWWECEIWDMFGVFFLTQYDLTRLLTDYGFQGHPLRKDFPLSGFIETRYNVTQGRVIYENVELTQEYRTFDFISPWEDESIIRKRQKT